MSNPQKSMLSQRIKEQMEFAESNYDDDDYTEEDALEHLMDECGQDSSGSCSMAGSEFCDWECPFSG
jgi:hypothetical protein